MNEYIASSPSLSAHDADRSSSRPSGGITAPPIAVMDPPDAGAAAPAAVPFHRLGRAHESHRWWRPLLTLLVAGAVYGVILVVLLVAFVVVAILPGGEAVAQAFMSFELDMADPVFQFATLLSLIALIPACLVGVRFGGGRPVGTLFSVTGRMRWGLIGRSTVLALVVIVASMLVAAPFGIGTPLSAPTVDDHTVIALVIALLLVPFQAAAEELAFRGLLPQVIGGWLRHPAWAYLLPVPFFVIGHDYSWVGLIDIAVFAIAMGVLTHRSGGLELAIGLHVVHNSLVFALAAFGMVDMNATEVGAITVAASVATTIVFVALALWRLPRWESAGRRTAAGAPAAVTRQAAASDEPGTEGIVR